MLHKKKQRKKKKSRPARQFLLSKGLLRTKIWLPNRKTELERTGEYFVYFYCWKLYFTIWWNWLISPKKMGKVQDTSSFSIFDRKTVSHFSPLFFFKLYVDHLKSLDKVNLVIHGLKWVLLRVMLYCDWTTDLIWIQYHIFNYDWKFCSLGLSYWVFAAILLFYPLYS